MFGNRRRIEYLEVKVEVVEVLEKLTATLTQEVSEITKELEKRKPKRDSRGRFVSKKK